MTPFNLEKEVLTERERRNIEILEILRKRGPISRPDISKELGINIVTVSNYIDEFIRHNLVLEKEYDISEGGRRPLLLDLNPAGGVVVGVGLNLMNMVGVLVDFKGNILTKTQIARPRPSVREITECILEIIREILRRARDYGYPLRGVGIGIAGLVNKKTGTIHWPEKMDHYYTYASVDVPLKQLVEQEFNLPVLIENDATCACFGEHWLDLEKGVKNVLYMFSGVGCGIMVNGEVYSGTNGYAGEVSIYNFKEDDLFNCQWGAPCFLKRWEMDLGILEETKSILRKNSELRERFLRLVSAVSVEDIDLKSIFYAAKAEDPVALEVLLRAGKRLGIR
ncbi:MAG: ROK family transcriptional regulator, partial [Candidatus Omnitrophica bacterium]|nr:ROK family transcriptional regulator [Candidatus Omnitrophota bacterium]